MPASSSRQTHELWLRSLVYVPVLLLLAFQILQAKKSSDKGVGIVFAPPADSIEIVQVRPGGPADQGGLRVKDVVLAISGRTLETFADYDVIAQRFERGEPVGYLVRRGEESLMFEVTPGMSIDWVPLLLSALLVVVYCSMGLLSLVRRPGSLPAKLLYWLFFLVALELAQPFSLIGAPVLAVVTTAASLLLNGAQFGTELHLVCLIPQRQRWLRRRPWVIPLFYGTGFGLGALAAGTYVLDEVWQRPWMPWKYEQLQGVLSAWMLVWATLMVVFLGLPTLRDASRQGRRQAGMVLLGALPWVVYAYLVTGVEIFGVEGPGWLYEDWTWKLAVLPLPLSIFVVLQIQSRVQNTLLMGLTSRLQSAGSVAKISELISHDLEQAFHTKCNYVFFRDPSSSDLTSVHSSGARVGVANIPESYEILRIADRRAEALVFPDDLEGELPPNEVSWLERLRANVVVPVTGTNHRLIGLLILGMKASEEPYIAHDFEIVRSLAGQIALAYENIGLQVQVHEHDRVQREVLDRLEEQEIILVKECPVCGSCFDSSSELCPEDGAKLALTLPVERTIDERYRLDRVLGKGGVAVVYKAQDLRLDRTVAVKVLARSVLDAPDASRRFEREAWIVAKLAHPRIVTIHDFGKTRRGCAFLVMEYLEGATLGHVLRQRGPYGPEANAILFEQILDGLGAAHRMGVVHRDLKPDNVLIARAEGDTENSVKLLDFGLAKFHPHSGVENTHLTVPGYIIGTLAYMSPEQLSGDEADERSDLFAVGVMVFEALTGRKPFTGRTPAQVLKSMKDSDFALPGRSRAVKRLNAVLERCLDPDPAKRFQSVPELRKVLIPAIRSCPPLHDP